MSKTFNQTWVYVCHKASSKTVQKLKLVLTFTSSSKYAPSFSSFYFCSIFWFLQNPFDNLGDKVESFFMTLNYDGIYQAWPWLNTKLVMDRSSFPLMVLCMHHFSGIHTFLSFLLTFIMKSCLLFNHNYIYRKKYK